MISYVYPDNGIRYKVVVKAAAAGRELWLSTFHLMRRRQTRSLLSRCEIIRRHD